MPNKQLIVRDSIEIEAPPYKIWKVLTEPEFIRQWDDLPPDHRKDPLAMYSRIEWPGFSTITVTEFEPNQLLRLTLYSNNWELPPANYDIGYAYRLVEAGKKTRLDLEIGDFAVLSNGPDYYGASIDFAKTALPKIKELAEQ